MPITEQDIKLLASQRMTDTPDGGGRMTGNVVQSGVDNNIFDDVSNLDRVYGNVSLRKVFAAVLTNDTDKYMGARVVIDQPPADPNVHALLFASSGLFDDRTEVSVKVESYLAPGPAYQGLLFGDHLAGMASVMLIQQTDRALPTIGQVLLLRKDAGLPSQVDQYVRILAVEATPDQRFTDGSGDFMRTVVTCTISDPLRAAFPGFAASRIDAGLDFAGKTQVMESVVADASQYFGIRALATPASVGDMSIKADTVYSPLLPSAQVETPIPDARTNGLSQAVAAAGGPVVQTITAVFSDTQALFVGGGIAPGTLSVSRDGVTLTDSGGALQQGGTPVGAVDYANGVLSLQTNVFGSSGGSHTVAYTPAFAVQVVPKSMGIDVTPASRSFSYVATLTPTPTKGSLVVSYLAGGRWYTLRDTGTGAVVGTSSALGAGTINFETGTLSVTLGALPDVGSAIILQWAEAVQAPALPAANLSTPLGGGVRRLATRIAHKPGMVLTWNDGTGAKTATVTGDALTGDAVGQVIPGTGEIAVMPLVLPPPGTVFSGTFDNYTSRIESLALPVGTLPNAPMQARTLRFAVQVRITYTLTGSAKAEFANGTKTHETVATLVAEDWGDGTLLIQDYRFGACAAGTVNNSTGEITFSLGAPYGQDLLGPMVYVVDSAGNQNIFAWNAYPEGSKSRVWSADAQTVQANYSGTSSTAGSLSVTPTFWGLEFQTFWGHSVVGARFTLGADTYVQDGSNLRRNVNPATGVGSDPVGTVSGNALQVTVWEPGAPNVLDGFAAGQSPSTSPADAQFGSSAVVFRTASAPLRVGSFSVVGRTLSGTNFNVTADESGKINHPSVLGTVDYQTGVVRLWGVSPTGNLGVFAGAAYGLPDANLSMLNTASLRYNAVAYSYLPLDASILGLDPVRLPQDGRVPVFKSGRVVVVHNTQTLAPATVNTGQTVDCGRTLLARIRVFGADGLEITSGFTTNLDAGTVTFTNVAGMSQPVSVEHRIEDEALCVEAQITGDLRLTRPLTHAYPVPGSYVSSALVAGTLQAAAQDSFAQDAWTNEWSDTRIGNPILAAYNDTTYPLEVTNAGAITERWAIIFTSSTEFNVVGESVGQIITGNTAADLSPVNPATGVPYFTLRAAGWAAGWAAGNVLRHNTRGAVVPVWVSRTVMQSPSAPPGTDQMVISIRGDIDQ